MRRHRDSLDALEAEIKETRRRIGELLGQADRKFGLRPGLQLARRLAGKAGEATDAAEKLRLWAWPAAAIAFAIGVAATLRWRRREEPASPEKAETAMPQSSTKS
jgi:hypothetical protein